MLLDFNCTIQELKQLLIVYYFKSFLYFNCTIQELKHIIGKTTRDEKKKFQLHHTGIKTLCHNGPLYRRPLFQLHHTGIKTTHGAMRGLLLLIISIAPYRN